MGLGRGPLYLRWGPHAVDRYSDFRIDSARELAIAILEAMSGEARRDQTGDTHPVGRC